MTPERIIMADDPCRACFLGERRLRPDVLRRDHVSDQRLRSLSKPVESWKYTSMTLETKLALEFVDRKAAVVAFPLQHTKCHQTAGEVMALSPRRAGLTATQAELILTDANDLFDMRPYPIQSAHLNGR